MKLEVFDEEYKALMDLTNDFLKKTIISSKSYPKSIFDAIEYSLFAGGKRLRSILLLATHNLLGGDLKESIAFAASLEMIHTYSLIHDDLPGMDNDDFRRGKPTNHRVFGEGIAILAGDALLNLAYETMIANVLSHPKKIRNHLKAMERIARAAGIKGMIGGQVVDLQEEGKIVNKDTLEYIHNHKTGALFMASLWVGVELEEPKEYKKRALLDYGRNLGLAFQVTDDILDETGDDTILGKSTGGDKDRGKATYIDFYGLEKAQSISLDLGQGAIDSLNVFGSEADFLRQLAKFSVDRHN